MKIVFLLLLVCGSVHAQQVSPDLSVTVMDTSLINVVRKYARNVKEHGLLENEAILVLRSSSAAASDPDESEWGLGNYVSTDELRRTPPALMSKIDGYWVAIYFNISVKAYFEYSQEYLRFLEQNVYRNFKSRLKTLYHDDWKITLVKGKKAIVLGKL